MQTYLLRAFTKGGQGGNPSGVVLNADDLSEEQMQGIAKKIGFSETAFVQKSDKADYKVQFFTPSAEVDLCGHATIATFSLLGQTKPLGMYTQEVKAGILQVEIAPDGSVFMEQAAPIFAETLDSSEVVQILQIPKDWIENAKLMPQVVSTGLRDMLVPIDTREHVLAINPNLEAMSQLSKKMDCVGMHVFTLDTIDPEATAHCRNFAPLYGIDEESATGTSNGALACYLLKNEQVSKDEALMFEQGYSLQAPSEILAKFGSEEGIRVRVGGRAVIDEVIEV